MKEKSGEPQILKAIVPKIPSGCLFCKFAGVWDSTKSKCKLMEDKRLFLENKNERPDWCPLVANEDLAVSEDGCHWLIEIPGACENERILK